MLPVITTAKGESPKPSDYHSKWESDRNPQVHSPKSKQRPPANTPLAMPSFTGDKDDGKVKLEDRSGLGGGIGGWYVENLPSNLLWNLLSNLPSLGLPELQQIQ